MKEKEDIAKKIKDTIEILNGEIAEAKKVGLAVSVSQDMFMLSASREVSVHIYEKVQY